MGTRHLIAVAVDGEYKIAQCGQWDGYPEGQGVDVLKFLSESKNIELLREKLKRVRFLDFGGQDKDFIEAYEKNSPIYVGDPDPRTEEQRHWFDTYIDRGLGAKILNSVAYSEDDEILLKNSIGFAGDSLFCEYAYVIDLDANTLEVYNGFNENEITEGRFVSGDPTFDIDASSKYEPVTLIKVYSLDNLPDRDTFISDLVPNEEDED